ncbi:MAG: FAD-binding protein, partial [Pirellula sp.]
MNRWNFGRNVLIESRNQFTPKNEEEVLEILNAHPGRRIRCVGRLHSWSRVLDSPDILLDLRNFNQLDPSDTPVPSVHVGAGCQIKQLIHELEAITPWTLPSLGFITEQTVAGAISTGTHGSGRHSLSHYVIGLRVARYDTRTGKAVVVDITDAEELRAARCSLGCIGVILRVTMQCRPQYMVEESFHEYPKLDEVLAAEQAYPLQQFYLVPWRWSFMAQHRRESPSQASRSNWIYQKYRFVILDLAMHWLILFSVRILRMPSAVRAVFRWIAPAFVIQNWRVVGPSSQQLIMEHEMFRHIELELFVQRHQLPPAMAYLRKALEAAGDSKTERSDDAPSPPS